MSSDLSHLPSCMLLAGVRASQLGRQLRRPRGASGTLSHSWQLCSVYSLAIVLLASPQAMSELTGGSMPVPQSRADGVSVHSSPSSV